ncbi:MAG: phage packaging protein Nu1 subunit of terminase [Akkermansiaceae bacterium]|nr:phage packaging protein Nu1 subunit of terminase [Akkermansiaceae bacterium]
MLGTDTELFTLADAAGILGKKTDTLKKWFANGCPHTRTGNAYEVRIRDVFDWRIQYERTLVTQDDPEGGEMLSLEVERAKLAKEQRLEKEMTNAIRRGELVESGEVEQAWTDMLAAFRVKILAMGSKVAAKIGGSHARSVKALVDAEAKRALTELAEGTDDEHSDPQA